MQSRLEPQVVKEKLDLGLQQLTTLKDDSSLELLDLDGLLESKNPKKAIGITRYL